MSTSNYQVTRVLYAACRLDIDLNELEENQVGQDDPDLVAIATQLRETAQYVIDPEFKERLWLQCLEMIKQTERS